MNGKLCFGYCGNGITVWYQGSNETIAYISPDREITYREKCLPEEIAKIEEYAKSANPQTTTSQPERKVFNNPAPGVEKEFCCKECGDNNWSLIEGYHEMWECNHCGHPESF